MTTEEDVEQLKKAVAELRTRLNDLISVSTKTTHEIIKATEILENLKKMEESGREMREQTYAMQKQIQSEIKDVKEFLEKSLSQEKAGGESTTPQDLLL